MAVPDPKVPPAGPKRNRNEFVRTKVPGVECIASVVILVLLGVIGGIIWYKGKHYDPSRYTVRTDTLKSTAKAVAGEANTIRSTSTAGAPVARATTTATAAAAPSTPAEGGSSSGEGGGSGEGGSGEGGGAAVAAPASGEPLELAEAGLEPMGATEFYNANNLFEKIDGRAPAYVAFNFQQMRCRSFTLKGTGGSYVDVYEYGFDTPIDAFGLFAQERDPQGKPLDYVADGYASQMGFFFRQGKVYVQILCSDQNSNTLAVARDIAAARAKALPVDDAGLAARRKLPAAGLIAASVTFVPENAQGQSFLSNVFQATYTFEGQKVNFFLMSAPADTTATAWKAYFDFSGKYGGTAQELPARGEAKLFSAENFGDWKVIYQRGDEIGGVVDTTNADLARKFVEKYLDGQIR